MNAYDKAEKLCHILMLHAKLFSRDDIIIYPTCWNDDSYFVIDIRSKKDDNAHVEADVGVMMDIIKKYGATCKKEQHYLGGDNTRCTPIRIKFHEKSLNNEKNR